MHRRASALAALLAGVALAAGCGDGAERNAYVDELNRVQQGFADTVARAGSVTATSTREEDERVLARFAAAVDGIVGDLGEIEVPADVAAEHRTLIDALEDFGTEVDEAGTQALDASSRREAAGAQRALRAAQRTVTERLGSTIAAINRELGG